MLKKVLLYLLLSILVVIFARYLHLFIVYIDMFYTWINVQIKPAFSPGYLGTTIRHILVLSFVPLILAGIPALLYRAVTGKNMPHFYFITWVLWLILVLSVILVR